ncbi:hypothetical protein ACOT0M_17650, partial [Enterobacter cloacae complex sp. ZZL001]
SCPNRIPVISKLALVLDIYSSLSLIWRYSYCPVFQGATSGTIAAIKEMYSGDSNDKDMPDADMFIKAQDWDDDWNQITVLHSDFDAVCTNVYVAFGKKQDHVIADCLVEEQGKWKVRSATLIK